MNMITVLLAVGNVTVDCGDNEISPGLDTTP
jgi:hypothetical protein